MIEIKGGIAMTQEEKQLLLKDLCARLPYGAKCHINGMVQPQRLHWSYLSNEEGWDLPKPYLRPMSSMTEEEFDKYEELEWAGDFEYLSLPLLDWLNKNMFDYRGLIEKGLALEAPEGMYN